MTAILTSLHISLIIFVGALLFAAIDWRGSRRGSPNAT
jgi:hypothetical protein